MIVLDPTTRQPIEINDPHKRLEYSRRLQQRKAKATSPAPATQPAPRQQTRAEQLYADAVRKGLVKCFAPKSQYHRPEPTEQRLSGDDRFAVIGAVKGTGVGAGVAKNFSPEDFQPGGKYWPK